MYFFKPEKGPEDYDALQAQAIAILDYIESSHDVKSTLLVGRAFWYDGGNIVRLDSYIFLKDQSGQWRRNRDPQLVNQVIRANL